MIIYLFIFALSSFEPASRQQRGSSDNVGCNRSKYVHVVPTYVELFRLSVCRKYMLLFHLGAGAILLRCRCCVGSGRWMEAAGRALGLSCVVATFLPAWHKFHLLMLSVDFGP